MAALPPTGDLVQRVIGEAATLTNEKMKSILRSRNLAVSGNKSVLHHRISEELKSLVQKGEIQIFNQLRSLIQTPERQQAASYQYSNGYSPVSGIQPRFTMGGGPARSPGAYPLGTPSPYPSGRLNFRESPFYTIMEPLTPVHECKVREATRDHFECKIRLSQATIDRMSRDPSVKAMVYCAADASGAFKVDIAFPNQVEIKVNQDEVKANLRGLKNKPGSTRPADITNLLHKGTAYENNMNVTYALTAKKFYLQVYLVQQHAAETLVRKLRDGKSISKEQVVREMRSKAQDSDIIATSSKMSLKCPLSTVRIKTPCRSTICTHNQCFDALSFLQLQEQAPTWTCPVCNRIVSFEALEVDQYVNEILRSTPATVDQVIIEPDGKWSMESCNETKTNRAQTSSDDDKDDLVEIQDVSRVAAIKTEALSPAVRTPPESSREPSIASTMAQPSSSKRPISAVIDLTLSSDDEDQSPRPPTKRQALPPGNQYPNPYSPMTPGYDGLPPRQNNLSFGLPRPNPPRPPNTLDYRFNQ